MRKMLATAAALACLAVPAAAQLDPAKPDDALKMNTKIICTTKAGQPVFWYWEGTVYSRIRGEKDRHLFDVAAMSVRQCQPFNDPVRGFGTRSVNREVMLYLDPDTKEVLRTWTNPWSGEEVEVMHVHNDPVNSREPTFARDAEGNPSAKFTHMVMDGYVYQGGGAALLFYDNPLAGEYQDYVGNKYQASEFLTATVPLKELTDPKMDGAKNTVISWGRISRWMPWMKMGGRDGLLVHYTGGTRLNSFEQLPEWMKKEVRTNYPTYVAPPPADDKRPNETSWTVFKKRIDAERARKGAR
jgi:hypothetical protein